MKEALGYAILPTRLFSSRPNFLDWLSRARTSLAIATICVLGKNAPVSGYFMQLVFARVHGLHLLCVTSRDLLPFEYGFGTQVLDAESPTHSNLMFMLQSMTNNPLVYGSFGV